MFKQLVKFCLVFIGTTLVFAEAHALTLGGQNYELFLTATAGNNGKNYLGSWPANNKYYTHTTENAPIDIDKVLFAANDIAGFNFSEVYAMGTTIGRYGPVNSGIVELIDASGQKLLTATLNPNGKLSAIPVYGTAGRFEVTGLYNVSGGLLAQMGILQSAIYIQFAFETGAIVGRKDIHYSDGTFNFFRQEGGNTEIPEPATALLLLSSLVGLRRMRGAGA